MAKLFTVGYIDHDQAVHNEFLGPCLTKLEGEFDVLSTSDEKFPASNYNEMVYQAKTPYIILTHQDVTFQPDLLFKITETISVVGENFGALGMVGAPDYQWSNSKRIAKVDTLDCCFIVIKTSDPIMFDDIHFGEYHLYVEDYCAQLRRSLGREIYTILIDGMQHHSATYSKLGACWGNYLIYKRALEARWPGIQTT